MAEILDRFEYQVIPIPVRGCLHLKSAVTQVKADTLLLNSNWIDSQYFRGYREIEVDPKEPDGANALLVGEAILYSESHPRTRDRLGTLGMRIVSVELSEMEKAEGAVTCCSLIFNTGG
jgi:dimethylargininase